ncbi:plastocyanin/azurin family copper-binding protein [Spirosoma areae]
MLHKQAHFCLLTGLAYLVCGNLIAGSKPKPVEVTAISISAISGLQYDLVRFAVKPEAVVTLTLTNTDDMSHNLVITLPGLRQQVVNASLKLGDQGPALNFVPKSKGVLWSIAVLNPGETKSITFTAPRKPGIYPYVCTYPGHGFVMYGAMYVTTGAMPPIQKDLTIPAGRRTQETKETVLKISDPSAAGPHDHSTVVSAATKLVHPYKLVAPYLYRVFIEDAGSAAIAVHLPHQLSYCWDAGSCRLRYAWQGEFLDNTDFWKGHRDANVKILGSIFYRDKTPFPLRIGEDERRLVVKFKGYRLLNRFPEFHYSVNDVDVFELLLPKEDGTGLIRTFRLSNTDKPIWFTFTPDDGVDYATSTGEPITDNIKLLFPQGGQFSVIMTKKRSQ